MPKAKAKQKAKPKDKKRRDNPDKYETITVKKNGSWETVVWGNRQQLAKLASEANPSHKLMQAGYFIPKRKEPKPSPLLYCSQCGVYATHRALGLKSRCVPPRKGGQPRGKNKTQHHDQYWRCETVAIDSGDSDLEVEPSKRVHAGRTHSSLGRLSRKLHPSHVAELLRVKPFVRGAKHKSVKPKSLKPREASVPTERGGETIAANQTSSGQSCVSLLCVDLQDIGTSERLAADAVGFEDDPEEEDHFGLCGL